MVCACPVPVFPVEEQELLLMAVRPNIGPEGVLVWPTTALLRFTPASVKYWHCNLQALLSADLASIALIFICGICISDTASLVSGCCIGLHADWTAPTRLAGRRNKLVNTLHFSGRTDVPPEGQFHFG